MNGTIGYLQHPYKDWHNPPYTLHLPKIYYTVADFVSDSGQHFSGLHLDTQQILTGTPQLDFKQKFVLNKAQPWAVPMEFTYGYAITYWKAQGSQWNKVLALEEKFPFDKETHSRALYTAVTRASEKLVLVRNK